MSLWKKIFSFSFVLVGAVSLSGCSLLKPSSEPYKVNLEVWGVFDDSDAYSTIFSEYKKINPYVKDITYRKLPVETYKDDLINALAAGKGPDIFMVRNAWRSSFEDKTVPAPDTLMTEREYRDTFADVVAADFIGTDNKIYGVPLSADSLALYYNKDLFNAAGIARPPETWEELGDDVKKLTVVDSFGNVTRSGIALGTANNINRATDVLTALMLQLSVSTPNTSAANRLALTDESSRKAFDFYADFARLGSPLYSWNARQHYSIDAFSEGTLAMMINYSWQHEALQQKNAKLNIGIAPLPQFRDMTPVNFANYWGYAVSKSKPFAALAPGETAPADPAKQNTLRIHEAWQFLKFMTFPVKNKTVTLVNGLAGTTKDFPFSLDPAWIYLEKTQKPAARRDLIEKQKDNIVLSAFALGNLIAKNWYQGNPEAVDGILIDAIESVYRGEKKSQEALAAAASRLNLLKRQ